ncbi:MAG: energy transducer TonB [Saprospiraceae bacterium]|nr:energy transducer TonB [Saprospiraceae bacterium]
MEKDKKKIKFVYQPEYPGGPKELSKFIYSNLRYPKVALENNIEGTVYIEYDVDYKGVVIAARVLKGIGHGCDEEAARVVKLLKFSVARNRGVQVLFHQKVRVKFALPKQKPAPQATSMQVTYSVTPAPAAEPPKSDAPEKKENTYSYTIKL